MAGQRAARASAAVDPIAAAEPVREPPVTPASQRQGPAAPHAALPAPCVTPASSSQRPSRQAEADAAGRPPSQAKHAQGQPWQTAQPAANAEAAAGQQEQGQQTPSPRIAVAQQQQQPTAVRNTGVFSPGTPTGGHLCFWVYVHCGQHHPLLAECDGVLSGDMCNPWHDELKL